MLLLLDIEIVFVGLWVQGIAYNWYISGNKYDCGCKELESLWFDIFMAINLSFWIILLASGLTNIFILYNVYCYAQ